MPNSFENIPSRRNPNVRNKWTWYPKEVLPMWVADMDLLAPPQILDALHKQVEHGVLGYELPNKALYEVVALRMKNLYGWEVQPESIVYTPGVNSGYNIAARILCSRQRGYLIQTPVYNEFHETEHKTGARQRVAQLEKKVEGNRIKYEVDFAAFQQEVKKVGIFLLCHPHNPVGKIYSPAELKRMAEICIENDVIIVSDEIHSEILLGDVNFTPLAGLSRKVAKHTITLISASKAFNVPGLACAFAIIPDENIRKKFNETANSLSYEISTPGLTAARVAFLGKADSWLKALRRYLTSNRDFIIEYIEKNLPGVRMTKPDATYLLWLDFSELKLQPSPYEFFLKKAKVAFSDGKVFGEDCRQFVRLNFGTTRKVVMEGLERIQKALK
jgi:cysteine-S-conjugate beta-lyase